MTKSKKIRKIITAIKEKKPSKKEIRSLASSLIEIMAESGIPPKIRREFYQYSQKPSYNLEKLIELAEDALGSIEK